MLAKPMLAGTEDCKPTVPNNLKEQIISSLNQDLKIVIVNRNYPPRSGITGESACKLARYLEATGKVKVTVVSSYSNYAGGGAELDPIGDVRLIRSWYNGKNKILRLFATFLESYFLIRTARSTKPDRVIVMTDPPFLQFWAPLLLKGKCPWTLWSMDIFPDAFVSSNLVKPNNWVYRFLRYLTYRSVPDSLISLGPLQAKYLKSAYRKPIESVAIIPCGVNANLNQLSSEPLWKKDNAGKMLLGYCGNLGEAHSVEFLKQVINHFDPERFHLVLSVYGVKSQEILKYAQTKKAGISIVPRVERDEMCFIDIHLVSLLKNWSHVCVPSKAVSAICSGSPILFYGNPDCDTWKMLGLGGWLIQQTDSDHDISKAVQYYLDSFDQKSLKSKKRDVSTTASALQEMHKLGYNQILTQLGIEHSPADAQPTTVPIIPSTSVDGIGSVTARQSGV